RAVSVPRSSAVLAQVLRPILCLAHEVIIVDAHFNPSVVLAQSKWLKPIRALASQLPTDGRLARFEVHALSSRISPCPTVFLMQPYRNNLAATLPTCIALNAVLWSERGGRVQFHKRLIVTDVGGVEIDPGIDEGPAGETYDLRLVGKQEISGLLAKFSQAT